MPLRIGGIAEARNKAGFHSELRSWRKSGTESTVSEVKPKKWPGKMHVSDGNRVFEFHADTKREPVRKYLELVKKHGNSLEWTLRLTSGRKPRLRAVVFGPDKVKISGFYLYKR
jgi:hypothetical protein